MLSRCALASLAMLVALAGWGTGRAEPPAVGPPAVQGLIVEPPLTPEARFARALNFIQSHGAPARTGQLARWSGGGVCPMARGLAPAFDNFVAWRVTQLAARVGAPRPRGARCWPNVEVLFTDKPQALMDLVARERDALLGFHYVAETGRLTTVTHPVEARYLTETQGAQGDTTPDIATDSPPGGLQRRVTGPIGLLNIGSTGSGCAGSWLTHCVSSLFSNVLIVVDTKAIEGRRIGPVADYIAMLALAQATSLDACDALPSILDLLSKACGTRPAPASWTDGDIAYLRALYRANLTTVLPLEKDSIANQMVASGVSAPTR